MTESKSSIAAPTLKLTLFTLLSAVTLIGVLIGVLCCLYADRDVMKLLESAERMWLSARKSGELSSVLIYSLTQTAAFLVALYVLGLCAVAQPLQAALPFVKGVISGVILAELYGESFTTQSIPKILSCMPGIFVSLIIVILAARESIYMSSSLLKLCLKDRLTDGMRERTKLYTVRMLMLLAASSVTAAADCALAMLIKC